MKVSIIFPVLNEEIRLKKGIENTIKYLNTNQKLLYDINIVDNGSTDKTMEIALNLCEEYDNITYTRIDERGVGIAFRTGVKQCIGEIVGYMDIDLSTDIKHLEDMVRIFESDQKIQYVNATRFSKNSITNGRKWYRRIISKCLLFMLHLILGLKASDAICGFTFMRRETAEELICMSSNDNGWFYMIELLIRAERMGVEIRELPVRWQEDHNTTVNIMKVSINYIKQITKLYIELNIKKSDYKLCKEQHDTKN